ncbi:MAG TPA: ABC transporter permease [Chthoniobacterales bacterium]
MDLPLPKSAAISSDDRKVRDRFLIAFSKMYLFLVFAVIILVGTFVSRFFLTPRNLVNIITAASITSVLAVGQFFVIVTGGIDLSVGSLAALSTVVSAILMANHQSAGVAILLTLLICGAVGLMNGLLVVYAGITPFIATLAMLSIVEGFSYIIQTGELIQIADKGFAALFAGSLGPIPAPVVVFLIITAIAAFVMNNTTTGRELYAIGGNREAARLSGLPLSRDLLLAYVVSGFLAGLAGLMLAAQLLEGSSLIGQGYELDSIAAVVVGGASLFGGSGDPIRAVIGGLIIATILNIMNLMGIQSQPQLVIKGLVILIAVFFTSGTGLRGLLKTLRSRTRGSARA